jgi:hypothetical protein
MSGTVDDYGMWTGVSVLAATVTFTLLSRYVHGGEGTKPAGDLLSTVVHTRLGAEPKSRLLRSVGLGTLMTCTVGQLLLILLYAGFLAARFAWFYLLATPSSNSAAFGGLGSALPLPLNMRHPLTGGGMTVAFKDVELLARCLQPLNLGSAAAKHPGSGGAAMERKVDAAVRLFHERRGLHASTINVLANALHRVFSRPASDDGTRERLRAACIEYLNMGGAYSAGPVGLLSGLTPKPWVLVAHFFAVALYAMRKALLPPTCTRLKQGYDLMHVACMIIMPLLAAEKATFLAWAPVQMLVGLFFPWKNAQLG